MDIPSLKRKGSKNSFTDDDDLSRMSDLDTDNNNNNSSSTPNSNSTTSNTYINQPTTTNSSRRMSLNSLPPSSPSYSYNKMSIDSDDAKSISSVTSYNSKKQDMETVPVTPPRIIRALGSNWITLSNTRQPVQQDEVLYATDRKSPNIKPYDLRERKDPEKRNVHRRSSLLPKSKALLRVMDQADEETHLADLEMRREHETTEQLKNLNNELVEKPEQGVPAASWTKVTDLDLYQCSKLNPEIEMTNFQLENLSSKSIKRKASEDRFDPYPTTFGLKRRAVSPSVSLSGSPILSGYSSPPASFTHYGASSPNAAARAQQKPSSNNSFNLQEASGGLSKMSLSE